VFYLCCITFSSCRRLEEEALYQSIKEARLLAQKAEEEQVKREEEERKRVIELKVGAICD